MDVLAAAARAGAVEVVLRGADPGHVDGAPGLHPYDRAVPLAAPALADAARARPRRRALPQAHGAPVRAIVPGWYAMASVKWLVEVEVLDAPYDGAWQVHDYRIWRDDLPAAGVPLGALPVSSLVTSPAAGARLAAGACEVRGVAWGGTGGIAAVDVLVDGAPLSGVVLERSPGAYGPTRFRAPWRADPGPHVVAARATDGAGAAQPDAPTWNRRGYGNNAVHAIEVAVARAG